MKGQGELRALQESPQRLLLEERGRAEEFMKEWYLMGCEGQEGSERSYVWGLVYGWELTQLSQSLITVQGSTARENQYFPQQDMRMSQGEALSTGENVVQYLSKAEMVVRIEDNVFWINPSLKSIHNSSIYVVTSANIINLLNFLAIAKHCQGVRLITVQPIYRKLKKLIAFLNTDPEQEKITQPQVYLLKAEEYFQYANIVWLLRENCWLQPSYDLIITLPHTKQTFLIEQKKLDQAKLVYYGWKKGAITEKNYQMYIREWDKSIIRAEQQALYRFPSLERKGKREMKDWYLPFIEKELIDRLTGVEQSQLFACCEVLELVQNQIICKKEYLFDYLFILLQGQFEYTHQSSPPITAAPHKLYGLAELQTRSPTYSFTLRSLSPGLVLRIEKNNVLFHLYDQLN